MPRRTPGGAPNEIRDRLKSDISNIGDDFAELDLRTRVRKVVPIYNGIRDLGRSLMPGVRDSGQARILMYLRQYVGEIIDGDELMVVAGISEWARRVRELRIEKGWPILNGHTANQLRSSLEEEGALFDELPPEMRGDQYILERDQQDVAAAARWETVNKIRKSKASVQDKILLLLRTYVGQPIHSEELRYVAGDDKSEWARRTRELRTQEGWPIVTKSTGDPSLPIGVYMLVNEVQAPRHDRHIPAPVRGMVMKRDGYSCRWRGCGWPIGFDAQHDHRFLEVHHKEMHKDGGSNTNPDNLVTLCNHHHDEVHRNNELAIT